MSDPSENYYQERELLADRDETIRALREENERLSVARDEAHRQHTAALCDLEQALMDKGRLEVWHERALAERDAARRELGEERGRFDMLAHLARQHEWSERTFGPGPRTAGVVDHIRKELGEIERAPADLEEWIDVVILALDGAWRSGASPEQIVAQLVAKQTKNESRSWPDWRTSDPSRAIEHVRHCGGIAGAEGGGT